MRDKHYLATDLNIRSAVDTVRKYPEIYLGSGGVIDGRVNERNLVSRLASDLITYGISPVVIDRFEKWWIVAAKED